MLAADHAAKLCKPLVIVKDASRALVGGSIGFVGTVSYSVAVVLLLAAASIRNGNFTVGTNWFPNQSVKIYATFERTVFDGHASGARPVAWDTATMSGACTSSPFFSRGSTRRASVSGWIWPAGIGRLAVRATLASMSRSTMSL